MPKQYVVMTNQMVVMHALVEADSEAEAIDKALAGEVLREFQTVNRVSKNARFKYAQELSPDRMFGVKTWAEYLAEKLGEGA